MSIFASTEALNIVQCFSRFKSLLLARKKGYFLGRDTTFLSPCPYIWPYSDLEMQVHS